MRFTIALSLFALVAQQAAAIALPVNDELTAELAARHGHHHEGARVRSIIHVPAHLGTFI